MRRPTGVFCDADCSKIRPSLQNCESAIRSTNSSAPRGTLRTESADHETKGSFGRLSEDRVASDAVDLVEWQGATPLLQWALAAASLLVVLGVAVVWAKGRPFAPGAVFRASRWSSGNHLLPTQVLITPSAVVQFTPGWIGKQEESIHMAHIASVKIQTGILLSSVFIETSGGASPIFCRGHRKRDAVEMKRLIELYQDKYYRSDERGRAGPPPG